MNLSKYFIWMEPVMQWARKHGDSLAEVKDFAAKTSRYGVRESLLAEMHENKYAPLCLAYKFY